MVKRYLTTFSGGSYFFLESGRGRSCSYVWGQGRAWGALPTDIVTSEIEEKK